ncbi:hotdog domain-containing protein [Pseudonocardia sp. ICBG1293]|uniref:thioesterase family protein n=1 Tax=Pseudonocardia sp. ICBG1293 TaxID=2844382 RepID=UPI001CCD4436|nr:hotdog domain-containing protein [Pseudonocardia sp. ICBG1293]
MTGPQAVPLAGLEPGTVEHRVAAADCVHRGGHDVLGTPSVVRLLEEAATVAIEPLLAPGQTSVGSTVDIAHIRPTVLGQRVTATATVVEIDRRRIVTVVDVVDDVERIAHGRHERFVVDDEDFGARLARRTGRVTEVGG